MENLQARDHVMHGQVDTSGSKQGKCLQVLVSLARTWEFE